MPKERIHDLVACYDVHVGWDAGPAGHVQVGVETHDGRSIAEWLTGDGQTPADFRGLWGTLDRNGVNRLIKTLQRARDAAFGKDDPSTVNQFEFRDTTLDPAKLGAINE